MIKINLDFPSRVLLRPVSLVVGMPSGVLISARSSNTVNTVWALHCAMEDGNFFFETLGAGNMIDELGLTLVAPSLGNGWFINSRYESQADFLDELFETLPQYLKISNDFGHSVVLGISMGGYGALCWALAKERFCQAISICGVLKRGDQPDARMAKFRDQKALYTICKSLLRRLESDRADLSPPALVDLLAEGNAKATQCCLYCGTEDYLALAQNEEFVQKCSEHGQPCSLSLLSGGHDKSCWQLAFQTALNDIAHLSSINV